MFIYEIFSNMKKLEILLISSSLSVYLYLLFFASISASGFLLWAGITFFVLAHFFTYFLILTVLFNSILDSNSLTIGRILEEFSIKRFFAYYVILHSIAFVLFCTFLLVYNAISGVI